MKKAAKFALRALALITLPISLLVTIGGLCFVVAFALVWFREGRLLDNDLRLFFNGAAASLVAGCVSVCAVAFWRRTGSDSSSNSFVLSRATKPIDHQRSIVAGGFVNVLVFAELAAILGKHNSILIQLVTFAGAGICLLLLLTMHIIFHELGHAAMAWCLDMKVDKIFVGMGRLLWKGAMCGLNFELRVCPQSGGVYAFHRRQANLKVRHFLFVAGGPVVDAICLFVLWMTIRAMFGGFLSAFMHGGFGVILVAVTLTTALGAFSGIVPHKAWVDTRRAFSDGYWLIRLWGMDERLLSLLTVRNISKSISLGQETFPKLGCEANSRFQAARLQLAGGRLRRPQPLGNEPN